MNDYFEREVICMRFKLCWPFLVGLIHKPFTDPTESICAYEVSFHLNHPKERCSFSLKLLPWQQCPFPAGLAHVRRIFTGRNCCLLHPSCFVLSNWEERSRNRGLWAHPPWPWLKHSLVTWPLLPSARNRALHSWEMPPAKTAALYPQNCFVLPEGNKLYV